MNNYKLRKEIDGNCAKEFASALSYVGEQLITFDDGKIQFNILKDDKNEQNNFVDNGFDKELGNAR